MIFQPPRAAGAAIPAVGKLHCQGVFAVLQQGGHVIGLVLYPLAVVRNAGARTKSPTRCPLMAASYNPQAAMYSRAFFILAARKTLRKQSTG